MNKQEYIKKIEDKLNSMNLGWKYQVSDYASNNEMEEEFEKEGKEEVSKVSNDLFSLFLDMAENMMPEKKIVLINSKHTITGSKLYIEGYNEAIDQFKEKIEKLRR